MVDGVFFMWEWYILEKLSHIFSHVQVSFMSDMQSTKSHFDINSLGVKF